MIVGLQYRIKVLPFGGEETLHDTPCDIRFRELAKTTY